MTLSLSFVLSAAALTVLLLVLSAQRRMDPIRIAIAAPPRNHPLRAKSAGALIDPTSPPQRTREGGQR